MAVLPSFYFESGAAPALDESAISALLAASTPQWPLEIRDPQPVGPIGMLPPEPTGPMGVLPEEIIGLPPNPNLRRMVTNGVERLVDVPAILAANTARFQRPIAAPQQVVQPLNPLLAQMAREDAAAKEAVRRNMGPYGTFDLVAPGAPVRRLDRESFLRLARTNPQAAAQHLAAVERENAWNARMALNYQATRQQLGEQRKVSEVDKTQMNALTEGLDAAETQRKTAQAEIDRLDKIVSDDFPGINRQTSPKGSVVTFKFHGPSADSPLGFVQAIGPNSTPPPPQAVAEANRLTAQYRANVRALEAAKERLDEAKKAAEQLRGLAAGMRMVPNLLGGQLTSPKTGATRSFQAAPGTPGGVLNVQRNAQGNFELIR